MTVKRNFIVELTKTKIPMNPDSPVQGEGPKMFWRCTHMINYPCFETLCCGEIASTGRLFVCDLSYRDIRCIDGQVEHDFLFYDKET